MTFPLHHREDDRLASLQTANVLDTLRDRRFDRIVCAAAQIQRVPCAMLAFVDQDRTWVKSAVGFNVTDLDRDTFCALTILEQAIFYVEDAHANAELRESRYVIGAPFIRFYAGVPILSRERLPIGSLCVFDRRPRTAETLRLSNLILLGRQIEDLLLDL